MIIEGECYSSWTHGLLYYFSEANKIIFFNAGDGTPGSHVYYKILLHMAAPYKSESK